MRSISARMRRPTRVDVDPGLGQDRSGQPALLLQQRRQQMFDIDLLVAVPGGLALRGPDRFLQFLREAIDVHTAYFAAERLRIQANRADRCAAAIAAAEASEFIRRGGQSPAATPQQQADGRRDQERVRGFGRLHENSDLVEGRRGNVHVDSDRVVIDQLDGVVRHQLESGKSRARVRDSGHLRLGGTPGAERQESNWIPAMRYSGSNVISTVPGFLVGRVLVAGSKCRK